MSSNYSKRLTRDSVDDGVLSIRTLREIVQCAWKTCILQSQDEAFAANFANRGHRAILSHLGERRCESQGTNTCAVKSGVSRACGQLGFSVAAPMEQVFSTSLQVKRWASFSECRLAGFTLCQRCPLVCFFVDHRACFGACVWSGSRGAEFVYIATG